MTDEIQNKVLALLAQEWDHSGPPGIMDLFDLTAALPLAPAQTLIAVRALFADGRVGLNETRTGAFLTPKGHAAAALLHQK